MLYVRFLTFVALCCISNKVLGVRSHSRQHRSRLHGTCRSHLPSSTVILAGPPLPSIATSTPTPVINPHPTIQSTSITTAIISKPSFGTRKSTPKSHSVNGTSYTRTTIKPVAISTPSLTPNGIKAGIAGGDAYNIMKDHIGWWYDWTPKPSKPGKPIAVPMLWGGGSADATDASRLKQFESLATTPIYVLGYEEPDCPSGSGSAGMAVEDAVSKWELLIAPMKRRGTKLGSPSMCKQLDETWLSEFRSKITTEWDFTAVHINKNSLEGVKQDVEYYSNKYGKPIWVTEFACVNDYETFNPCTNQAEINRFIEEAVPYFEEHPNVRAYGYSNGLGLGNVWPLMKDGKLSDSGKTYLNAISKYH